MLHSLMVEKLNMVEDLQAKVFREERHLRLWGRKMVGKLKSIRIIEPLKNHFMTLFIN